MVYSNTNEVSYILVVLQFHRVAFLNGGKITRGRDIEKKIYEFLGVNIFRKYILFTVGKLLKLGGYKVESQTIDGVKKYKLQSKIFAVSHIGALVYISIDYINKSPGIIGYIIQMVINSYCIMVQRYNHIRINEILEKHEKLQKRREERHQQKENDNQDIATKKIELTQSHTIIQPLANGTPLQESAEILRKKRDELLSYVHYEGNTSNSQPQEVVRIPNLDGKSNIIVPNNTINSAYCLKLGKRNI